MEVKLMTGNEAAARGFYEAGGLVASSYPGSPTVELLEAIRKYTPEVYAEFSVNEKVALEVGIGASFTGARTLVSMKHVGVNIAMDPLMTFTQTPVQGGFLLVSGEDPGMASSQNEQDNRVLGKFANMAILDAGSAQEAKDFAMLGLSLSEDYGMPVMLRMTSRVCHSRSPVELGEREAHEITGFSKIPEDFGMVPPNTFPKQYEMKQRIIRLAEDASGHDINFLEAWEGDSESPSGAAETVKTLVITSGLMYYNLKELKAPVDIYKLGMVYPLPVEALRSLVQDYEQVLVLEELTPFIENELKLSGIACEGKKYFSFTGELHTEMIEAGLVEAGVLKTAKVEVAREVDTVARISMFCAGCPHRPVFDILKKNKISVLGDIGCYSLAVLEPLHMLSTIISMGSTIGILKGMSKALALAGKSEPLVSVIGDGTFFHSGMTGALNLLHQLDPAANLTLIILNNGTTAMTGGQMTATSGSYTEDWDMNTSIPELLKAMGFPRVVAVDQFDYKAAKAAIEAELKFEGLSIVMTTRPCALNFKIREPYFVVDPQVCIGCRSCVKTNCPPIVMKAYEGIDKLKSSIDPDLCVGCSVCAQVCPVNAISRVGDKTKGKGGGSDD
ncbi:indolepyruvate ferredoxin oxidoreductase subunit alpha [Acidaminobacter hydrogenoformans]|uniref:Indolepyruvate oxidoreductase subunit IorA n=1 Tax=Acidaminobacter hydrogenoformans DSM 2784 TaxID=1120920 RepID=A0A1G5RQ74_9FIRM|nr:indolepyruvate ferredoxin oxidoreductase subunit alpha [Acidaminobacter hydrogenoformans]SCZ76262.1 indolepyruvate ferredoxin oxidoreductase alpha subunit [Acidaminobacter hydrogenoformans DSM 2784]